MTRSIEFQNVTVVDGSGRDRFISNVLVEGERIRRVSDDPSGADREMNLEGCVLTPGFIDMHAHSELRLLDHPGAAEKLTQGFTLEVGGQDGVSVAPVPESLKPEWERRVQTLLGRTDEWNWNSVGEFLERLGTADPAINCAYYAPHGNLRSTVAGFEDRQLDPEEMRRVQDALTAAIDAGAFAMSKGMIYPPSSYGGDEEYVALAETLGSRNSFMVSHVWNETDCVVESIERYIDICERGGCDPHVSHLKVGGKQNWGHSTVVLDAFDGATERGVEVTFDQYPYTAGSTMLTALLPPWARQGESDDILDRLTDPQQRRMIHAAIKSPEGEWENLVKAAGTWDNILITRTASGKFEGKTISDVASAWNVDPLNAMCDLLVKEDLDVTMADFIMNEDDIERFLADERGTICSDGIFGGKPHPRTIATGARILERYVREKGILPLETAVFKLAGHPADVLGLPDRGRIEDGCIADLAVFDLDAVEERATYEDPMNLSRGIEYVLVNGEIVVDQGVPTGKRPGQVLRSTDEWTGSERPRLRSRQEK